MTHQMIYHGDHGWTLGEKYFFLSPNRSIVNDNATDKIIIVDIIGITRNQSQS